MFGNYVFLFGLIILVQFHRFDGIELPIESDEQCDYQLVQTLPQDFTYEKDISVELAKTHEVYLDLIRKATKKIQVASFYLCLLAESPEHINHHSSEPGRLVLEALESAARDRKIQVEVVIGKDEPTWSNQIALARLREAGVDLKVFDVGKLLGDGVMHSKFIVTDEENFYLGSANWDWRSLTQVKEFGIVFRRCSVLAQDLTKIFKTYQLMSQAKSVPEVIPEDLVSNINKNSPLSIMMDNAHSSIYMGSSPAKFNGANNHRSHDLEAILETIKGADKFVYISVMNYSPVKGFKTKVYWPIIENALKAAVYERKVQVKLLISTTGKPFRDAELAWYKSLDALNTNVPRNGGIEVRFFTVDTKDEFLSSIPHSRLKHDKYMVTDKSVYIGTSNWQPDYFINTCGVGLSIRPNPLELSISNGKNILTDMKAYFERDFSISKNISS